MKTSAIFFAFDLFGSAGSAQGVHLLADELREILADNKREKVPTRASAYSEHVRIREADFHTLDDYAGWRRHGRQLVRQAFRNADFLVWASGNHLGALPVYDELAAQEDVLVVQFDAHLDIHQFRDCTSELSHGNFLLHVEGRLPPLINIGHRDLLLKPEAVGEHYAWTASAADLATDPGGVLRELGQRASRARRIFLDLDCDVLDPVHFPAVGQPVPFGLSPPQLLGLIEAVWSDRVQGILISEFDPGRDRDDRSLATLVWLLEHLLLRRYEGRARS